MTDDDRMRAHFPLVLVWILVVLVLAFFAGPWPLLAIAVSLQCFSSEVS